MEGWMDGSQKAIFEYILQNISNSERLFSSNKETDAHNVVDFVVSFTGK